MTSFTVIYCICPECLDLKPNKKISVFKGNKTGLKISGRVCRHFVGGYSFGVVSLSIRNHFSVPIGQI